jgi:predicted CXXCH cytochrome family protein
MRLKYWVIAISIGMTLSLSTAFMLDRRGVFLPGRTSDGHHTIEQSCNSCHVPFAAVPNKNCSVCHAAEIKEDTHPVKLFDDPRWADMLQKVNALECVNCHREHEVTGRGVTVDKGFCYPCHDDVTVKRESHKNLSPLSCWDGGCHNYHDNTALNIAFLSKRLGGTAIAPVGAVLERPAFPVAAEPEPPDAPAERATSAEILRAWRASAHAQRSVNCSDCHGNQVFDSVPGALSCTRCHASEVESFGRGKHGAGQALKLAALTPPDARRPMNVKASERRLTCAACHDPHGVDTRKAAAEACLGCHADRHSQSFRESKHGRLFFQESGARPSATGVSCATCHMPRTRLNGEKNGRVVVNHNNSWTLLPRDRMVKEVCLACHDLEFSINSIFDERLIQNNFQGVPTRRHETLKMVEAESRSEKTNTKREN